MDIISKIIIPTSYTSSGTYAIVVWYIRWWY